MSAPQTKEEVLRSLRSLVAASARCKMRLGARDREEAIETMMDIASELGSDEVLAYIDRHPESLVVPSTYHPRTLAEARRAMKKGTEAVDTLMRMTREARTKAEAHHDTPEAQREATDHYLQCLERLRIARARLREREGQFAALAREAQEAC